MKRFTLLSLLGLIFSVHAIASDFAVDDIRIEGLQQVDPAIVFRNFPINRGDLVDQRALNDATKDLFESGYFDDVELLKDQGVLIVRVKERPSVALIRLEGNDLIKDEQLMAALKRSGLEEGDVFRRSALDQIRLDLLQVYNQAGRYTAEINTDVEQLDGNRVALNIKVTEGETAVVQKINIIGNSAFSDEELLGLFDLGTTNLFSWWTDNDKYAREKLSADIERLRSYYLDRGFVKFDINSSDVSISPDQKQVFVTISLTEGQQYKYTDIDVVGEFGVDKSELTKHLQMKTGDLFSRKLVVETNNLIQKELGDSGYLFAKSNAIPEVDDQGGVALKFYVEPGKLVTVRRIEIRGNAMTADEVIRRELPQMEGSVASADAIERSKTRLDRLGFFSKVDIKTLRVASADDQVDLQFSVEEQSLGQINAGVGYSSAEGILFDVGLQQDNFLGTGTEFGFAFNNSQILTQYTFSFNDPYYTLDGVGRGYDVYYRTRDFGNDDLSDYNTNEVGASVNFGYPIDENQRVTLGVGLDSTDVNINESVSTRPDIIDEFVTSAGSSYLTYNLNGRWRNNHLNNAFFPTDGYLHDVRLDVAVPGGDLAYYKASYTGRYYQPLNRDQTWVFGLKTRNGFAGSLDSNPYPFFQRYFAGGLRTVRGFANNSLGPKDGDDPIGGNILLSGSAELIFPAPFLDEDSSIRTIAFLDGGNVFTTDSCSGLTDCSDNIDIVEVRFAAGVGLSWITAIGPLSISFGQALNASSNDTKESVQFSLGQTF
ncbi:Outer membrane protein assembly factor BamA precursor [Marinobacterium sp. xm-g-59]|uniref:outer membrane protein assembly factor BamA n=1 Tax=Marinobacterium sp. xm-g-59 TaxID=2497748 RepID=UPI001569B967|nr:outer membrane protein assembly factor BamA [Marinobacterium sp. xm-g-59]NRP95981.1 Outer membrane protein assembly factor BamA precursor [Marinobacterium sp. xm-g-59]